MVLVGKQFVKRTLSALGLDYRAVYQTLFAFSLKSAIHEQGLWDLLEECRRIVPDISDQHTWSIQANEYRRYAELKMRGMHVFQIRCALDALKIIDKPRLTIADIGDSSGNHAQYLKQLAAPGQIDQVISINLDPVAVKKVQAKGGKAFLCRAEELDQQDLQKLNLDIFMSFEMIEHLTDPAHFFYKLAISNSAKYLLMSVPYLKNSRVGFEFLRSGNSVPDKLTADDVHIFELAPKDWIILARFSGWSPMFTRIYWQYPHRSPLRITGPLWRMLDYEGFFGVLFRRDLSVANRYVHW